MNILESYFQHSAVLFKRNSKRLQTQPTTAISCWLYDVIWRFPFCHGVPTNDAVIDHHDLVLKPMVTWVSLMT